MEYCRNHVKQQISHKEAAKDSKTTQKASMEVKATQSRESAEGRCKRKAGELISK